MPARQKGFSLIELIVVLAIIATVTGVVVPRINFGGDKKQIRSEALRLAELEGDNRTGKWVAYESDTFRKREWPEGFEIEVEIAGVGVALEPVEDAKIDENTRPHVMMLSNGEIMPDFKVIVDKGLLENRWQVATGVEQQIEFSLVDSL